MVWWKRFFKKKTEPVEEDDWEQVVYTRNGVNFEEEDQRKRYIVNCRQKGESYEIYERVYRCC